MPRSVRDSDEDVETRTGRKTRAGTGIAVPESPVRRSSRNKQSTKQNDSSPDLSVTETSSTQSTRSFRNRAGTIDSNSLEIQRRLRSSRNTVDMVETKDSEASIEAQPKKMTRRSIAVLNTPETAKVNTRTRRLTRAGSETKSTPTGRTTRKTRASSMDPESTIEQPIKDKYDSQVIDTPSRAKRRASVLPSQSTVIEEEEKQVSHVNLKKTLIEEDELTTSVSPDKVQESDKAQESLESKTNEEHENIDKPAEERDCSVKGPVDHSSKNDHMEISENIINEEPVNEAKSSKSSVSDQSNILGKDKDYTTDVEITLTKYVIHNVSTDSSHNAENISKEVELKDENMLHVSLEEGEINTSNKENEYLNTSNSLSKQNKNESILNVSIEEGEVNTSNKENECLNIDSSVFEQNKNNIRKLNQEASITVFDTSTKEDKNVQCNDDIKLNNFCLTECSVSVSNCDNLIQRFNVTNEIQNNSLHEENNSVSILDTKETTTNEEHDHNNTQTTNDKSNIDSITAIENSDTLKTISYKILNEEDTTLKEQCKLDDSINAQIQDKTITEEENNLVISGLNTDNTKKIHCNDETKSEVNVSLISNNASNISVNPKENLVDTSAKEDNCSENVKVTEIADVNNDINESTISKDSHIKQDDILSTNENQNRMSTSAHNSPTVTLQVSDDSTDEPTTNTEQTKLRSSECLINLQSPKLSNSILETNDSSTVTESHDVPEEDLPDNEGYKQKSSSETSKISKTKSITELNTSKTGEEIQKNDVQNIDEGDNILSAGMLFQDISADEWKQKHKNLNTESENNSVHSTSTVKLENDSETECDLILVDKEAWLAAENIKSAKEKESFDYDSDDTIVLKSKMDYLNDRVNKSNEIQSSCKDSKQDNDKVDNSESKKSSKKIENKLNEETNIDGSDANISLQNTSMKEKSVNKTEENVGNISKNDSVKSSNKQLEEEDELTLSQKASDDHDKSQNKLVRSTSGKKENKDCPLNSSLNKKSKSKQRSNKYNRLRISSSEEEDKASSSEDNKNVVKSSGKKGSNKNYSTMVHIGSDSDTCDDSIESSNSDTRKKSLGIPRFLFKHKDYEESDDESNEDGSSKRSIDSDINAEYNLDGKTIGKFSDDDIPGDECRASESESSDPDDNGSDLADFVVDDDEVEEEEEGEEDENEEEEQEEDEKEDQEMKDENVTEDKHEKKEVKSKNIVSSEEKNKDTSNKSLNVSNIKSDKKKNQKHTISSEVHSAESAEDETVSDSEVNASIKLDSNLSEKKKKKKQKLNENNEIVEETPKRNLNESEIMFTRKTKRASISLTCSTPKTDIHQHEQFKHNISSEKKKRKYMEKTSINNDPGNIGSKVLSPDSSDNNKATLNNSENTKKRHSVENNIPADLLELVKDTNLSKPFLTRKTHLNKTMSPMSETPTTKYLKTQKLNESAPFIKLQESKGTSENISFIDKKKDITKEGETSTVVEEAVNMLGSDSSLSIKRKRSTGDTDLGDQTDLSHKKVISKTEQVSEVEDKPESHIVSDNEKENSECTQKVDDGTKKRRKKNKKNKSFKELDIVDIDTKVVEESVENDKKIEMIFNTESKKNMNKNKYKENIENENKINDEPSIMYKNYKKGVEVEDIQNKKKKKVATEIVSQHVKEQSKKSFRKDVSKGSTSSNVKLSEDEPESVEFFKLKYEALEAAKRATEIIKADKDMKKKHTKHFEKMQQEKEIKKLKMEPTVITTSTRGTKRFCTHDVDSLSDVPMRPLKKQKLSQKPGQAVSHIVTKNGFEESSIVKVNKNFNPSNCGGTTEFDVVNLQKAKKQLKKNPAVVSFRQKMLSRNSRYPVTNYLMYLQKQKASGHGFVKQF